MTKDIKQPSSDADSIAMSQSLKGDISSALINARLTATPLDAFPGSLPTTLADAYDVQSLSIERWPDSVAGWKVGGIPAAQQARFGKDRLAGPVFSKSVARPSDGAKQTMPIFDGGFAAVEAEFVIEIGATIEPVTKQYSDDELRDLIKSIHVGVEVASSPMAKINEIGAPAIISDFGNNAGLVVGPEIPDWRSLRPNDIGMRVSVGGEVIGSAKGTNGAPLQALRFLLENCADRNIVLKKGTLITTGAVTGIHELPVGSCSTIEFPGIGSMSIEFVAQQPRE